MKRLTPFLAGVFLAFSAHAADLTIPQMQTLKALALADTVAGGYVVSGNDTELAAWFNVPGTKIVWRSTLQPDVMRDGIVAGAAQLDNLTVGKRDALLYLVSGELPNTPALRATLDDLCGTQNTLKASIAAAEKRSTTRAESALATGTGTALSPATLGWEGFISVNDASNIRVQ